MFNFDLRIILSRLTFSTCLFKNSHFSQMLPKKSNYSHFFIACPLFSNQRNYCGEFSCVDLAHETSQIWILSAMEIIKLPGRGMLMLIYEVASCQKNG